MSAQDNLSYEQMSMFMTPGDIKSKGVHHGERIAYDESDDQLWDRKYDESHSWDYHGLKKPYNLTQQIVDKGVRTPVTLSSKTGKLTDGYHRVAVAAERRPKDVIPVEYE